MSRDLSSIKNRFTSASIGTLLGSFLSILSFLLVAMSVETEKLGVIGLHLVVSGLLVNLVSCRAELIIPRLSIKRGIRFGIQVITLAFIFSPIIITLNYFIYNYILSIKNYSSLPLLTALHTLAFVIFLVFNACNINSGDTRRVIISYISQGGIYFVLVFVINLTGSNNVEYFIIAHISSFVFFPLTTNLKAALPTIFRHNFFNYSEVIKEKAHVYPLVIQGLVNSSSIALLYSGVNLVGTQSDVGIFTLAHKVLSFPLRAISLPLRQVFTIGIKKKIIRKRVLMAVIWCTCAIGIITKLILTGFDVEPYFGEHAVAVMRSVDDLFLWWVGALVALPAAGASISASRIHLYTFFETVVLFSRAAWLGVVSATVASASFFVEVTSTTYFAFALVFAIAAISKMEE